MEWKPERPLWLDRDVGDARSADLARGLSAGDSRRRAGSRRNERVALARGKRPRDNRSTNRAMSICPAAGSMLSSARPALATSMA